MAISIVREDPIQYCVRWSEMQKIDVPVHGQEWHVTKALEAHASLLYDNPLTKLLRPRDRFRMIRKQLAKYASLLSSLGVIPTLIELKRLSHLFLRSFFVDTDGHAFLCVTNEMRVSPLWGLAATLDGVRVTKDNFHVFQYFLTWHVYLSKLPLTRPDLSEPAKIAWVERQKRDVTVFDQEDILPIRYIAGWLFELYPEFIGAHGPGSTSIGAKTVPDKNAKYRRSHQTDLLLRYTPVEVLYDISNRIKKRDSKYGQADKDIGSVRPLTMMPPEDQFGQQGLKYDWYAQVDWVRECNLSHFVSFNDQEPSRLLALYGSQTRLGDKGISTLDSKNASDLLSVELLINVLSGDTLHYVMLGRSWNCKVPGVGRVELSMYDGMGSALTFPVQTLVFTAVSIWSTILMLTSDEPNLTWQERISTVLGPYGFKREYVWAQKLIRTFGDDIILPVGATDICIKLLTRLGLMVNEDKSFIGSSPVRESCGMYAVGGYDVTPLRYRIPIQARKSLADAAFFESVRSHVNNCYDRNYRNLYRCFLNRANSTKPFISGAERRRKTFSGKRGYTEFFIGDAPLLHSGDEPGDPMIGFKSTFPSIPNTKSEVWGRRISSFSTLAMRTVADPDKGSDFYHLCLWYRRKGLYLRDNLSEVEQFVEKVGKKTVPRGIRLIRRNAIWIDRPIDSGIPSAWEWAPR